MKLLTAELKAFKAKASMIKDRSSIPILDFLKFDKGTVTKNNLNSFLVQEIQCDESFLISEKILMNLVDRTSAKEIEVEVSDKRIKISDGLQSFTSPTENLDYFPKNDMPEGDPVNLSGSVIEAIFVASRFILDEDDMPAKCNVFIGNGSVCGNNGFVAYFESVKEKIPNMVLSKHVATAISKFPEVDFSENKSYHFFSSGKSKFGFSKPTYPFFDMSIISKIPEGSPAFSMNKSPFVAFNDGCISASPSKTIISSMDLNGKLHLEMNDSAFAIDAAADIEATGKNTAKFHFNPVMMNTLLKGVPDETLTFHQSENKYYITGESGFVSLIMEIK